MIEKASLFLSGLFVLMIINTAVYTHGHKTKSGKWIIHAHPYNQKGHTHSNSAFHFLNHFELLINYDIQSSENFQMPLIGFCHARITESFEFLNDQRPFSLRAPPNILVSIPF